MTMHYTRCKEACERLHTNSGKSTAVARFWAGRIFLRDDVIIPGILSSYATILDSSASSPRDILHTVNSSASGPQGRGRLEVAAFFNLQEQSLNLQEVVVLHYMADGGGFTKRKSRGNMRKRPADTSAGENDGKSRFWSAFSGDNKDQ